MRRLLCLLAALGFATALAAQPVLDKIAGLERDVAVAGARPRFGDLLQLSTLLEAEDGARAWSYAQRAREAATSPAEQLRADLWLDYLLWRQGKHSESFAKAREGVARARALHDDDLLARGLFVVALSQDRMADFAAVLETARELLPLVDQNPDLVFRGQVYDQLGVSWYKMGKYAEAEAMDNTARKYAEQSGDLLLLPSVLSHLALLPKKNGEFDRALKLLQQSVDLRIANGGDRRGIADQMINIGAIYEDQNDLPNALLYYQKAVALHATMGFALNHANALQCLAGILVRLGRTEEAVVQLNLALKIVEPTGSQTIISRVYRELAELDEARGDYKAALEFARKQAVAEDAALGEKSRVRQDELNALFQTERKQNEIDRLSQEQRLQAAELTRARWQRYSLLAGALALVLILGVLAWRFRSERRLRLQTEAARVAADEANLLKTRLLGIASHDLKGPLNSISRAADWIARDPRNVPDLPAKLLLIRDTAQRTFTLVRDLIDVAALESRGLQLTLAPVAINDLTASVVREHEPAAAHKDQRFVFTPAESETVIVMADAARLRQAIDNLVSNAIKFTPPGKGVRVTVRIAGERCFIDVADEGPGLTPEDMAQAFQPFRTLSAQPTGGESSSGLGLSLSRQIVRLHRGDLDVRSAPGQGATFTIALQLCPRPSESGVLLEEGLKS